MIVKPKAKISQLPATEKKHQARTLFESRDTSFVFSDKIEDWMIGKSQAAKKSKDLF
jgi:hypothetical protein